MTRDIEDLLRIEVENVSLREAMGNSGGNIALCLSIKGFYVNIVCCKGVSAPLIFCRPRSIYLIERVQAENQNTFGLIPQLDMPDNSNCLSDTQNDKPHAIDLFAPDNNSAGLR